MAVSKRTRFEVFKRDGFRCQYCGRTPPQVVLQADHIHPASDGGPDTADNLVTACEDCNAGKSDVPLSSVPRPLAAVMEEAAEKREQLEAYNQFLVEQKAAEDGRVEQVGRHWFNKLVQPRDRDRWVFGDTRAQSIRTFLRRLPFVAVVEAVDIAHARIQPALNNDEKCWKYFCGVCWKKIRDAEGQ